MARRSGRDGRARPGRRTWGTNGCYELRVEGHLDETWSSWFDGLTVDHEVDGTTTLSGVVADQARLHGLLDKVRDLGMTLISVRVCDDPVSQVPPGTQESCAVDYGPDCGTPCGTEMGNRATTRSSRP